MKTRPKNWGLNCLATFFLLLGATHSAAARPPDYERHFNRTQGWTGADGCYSFSLCDGRTLWAFSDTFYGDVVEGTRQEPFRFVNNSMVLHDRGKVSFLEAPVFTPPDRQGWYWLFDGLNIRRGHSEILLGQFDSNGAGGALGFEQIGLWWARYQLSPDEKRIVVTEYRRLPYCYSTPTELFTFGSAITEVGPWAYVFGVRQTGMQRDAIVARAPLQSLGIEGTWRFFDGHSWQRDPKKCQTLFSGASVEFSVHQTQAGEFVYVGATGSAVSSGVFARKAPSITGPWSESTKVADTPEHQDNVFCYNPKAHPELIYKGLVPISYNVNTTDLKRVVKEADIYRPRFRWWKPPDKTWLPK